MTFGWTLAISFTFVCLVMLLGEVISRVTKGNLPQMFIVAVLFLVGFWTFVPKDILNLAGMDVVASITKLFILIHVGAMFDLKSMVKDWRVVITTLAAVIGICLIVIPVGTLLFGKETALIATPPLTGGGMAAMIMQDGAIAIDRADLGTMAMIIFIMQGFVGFPATAFFLRKEAKRLVESYRANPIAVAAADSAAKAAESKKKKTIISRINGKTKTYTFYLAQLGILAVAVELIDMLLKLTPVGVYIDKSITSIVVGLLAAQFGFLESNPLERSESSGILTLALFASFMGSFAYATISTILSLLAIIVVLLALATVGILAISIPVGKKLGYSTAMAAAIGLNCFLGFPYNYSLTNEAIALISQNEEETAYLTSEMMPKMIIGSVVAVSTVSCVLAGIFVPLLAK